MNRVRPGSGSTFSARSGWALTGSARFGLKFGGLGRATGMPTPGFNQCFNRHMCRFDMSHFYENQFFSSPFNSGARGWSLWRPNLGNWILWETLFLNRLHIYSFLISISFLHIFLKSKFLEKILCRKKNRP